MYKQDTIIKLESLINLSARLNSAEDQEFIINSALLTLMGKLKITRACALAEKDNAFHLINKKGSINLDKINLFEMKNISSVEEVQNTQIFLDNNLFILIPLDNNEQNILICLGTREFKDLQEDEKRYASLVCNITSNALKNASNLDKLKQQKINTEKQNQLLTTMFDIRKDFSNLRSREQLIKTLSLNLMGQLMISKFMAIAYDENDNLSIIINRFHDKFSLDNLTELFELDETYQVNLKNEFNDINKLMTKFGVCVVSHAFVKGDKKGMLIVGPKMNNEAFTEDNIRFIEALGNTFFTELENERLFREEIEKKRLESELSLALEIQKKLLPKQSPALKNFKIFGKSIPSRHVGGDYFDYIKLDEENLLFVVADVSGKGIPASLIMANFQAGLRTLTPLNLSLDRVVQNINKLIFDNTASDKFVTAFFGVINDTTKALTYINAGHNPPYLIRNGNLETLNEGGLLLGIMSEAPKYEIGQIDLKDDDMIYIFTDGVSEAKNLNSEEYGEKRLEKILLKIKDDNVEDIVEAVYTNVASFAYGAGQYDDLTAIAIKCKMNNT